MDGFPVRSGWWGEAPSDRLTIMMATAMSSVVDLVKNLDFLPKAVPPAPSPSDRLTSQLPPSIKNVHIPEDILSSP